MDGGAAADISVFWQAIGIIGGLIFYGRFYVQWIASERAGRSVMPLLFWYMSSVGSVSLMVFAVATQSPLGALSQSFNLIVYGRNLIHIWWEHGTLSPTRRRLVQGTVAIVAVVALYFLVQIWLGRYHQVQEQPEHVSRRVWFWLAVGVAGQALFAARFIVQWAATELQRRSVIPRSFWYLSVAASGLQAAAFLQQPRPEWVFGIGMIATIFIYLRNIWFVHKAGEDSHKAAG